MKQKEHPPITGSTAGAEWLSGVADVEVDQTALARQVVGANTNGLVATDGATGDGIAKLLVDNDVVSATDREFVPVTGELLLGEGLGASGVEVEQLLHVKELNTVFDGL